MDTTSRRSDTRRDRDAIFLRPEPGTRDVLAELAKQRGETMAVVVASLVRAAARDAAIKVTAAS